jgi:Flp pilus assembly protein TadG
MRRSTETTSFEPNVTSERGAILIHVGLALFVLVGLTAIVFDYGVLWLGRRQAQNAADAGALAGVIARAYDEPLAAGPVTTASAQTAAAANMVFGTPAVSVVDAVSACPGFAGGGTDCVRVDVYRDGTNGSAALPTYFAAIFGQSTQGVKATATGQVLTGNAAKCMKPWIVPDIADPDGDGIANPGVTYSPPTAPNPNGYRQVHIGKTVVLTEDSTTPSFYLKARTSCPGNQCYLNDITGCTTTIWKIGDLIQEQPGNGPAPAIETAINTIIAEDPGAHWDSATQSVQGSCAPTCACGTSCSNGLNGLISPRVVPVAIGDPAAVVPGAAVPFTIVNIYSFLLMPPVRMGNHVTLHGVLVSTSGLQVVGGGGGLNPASSFLVVPALIQ